MLASRLLTYMRNTKKSAMLCAITPMKKKLLLIPFTIIASLAVFGPMASADTMQLTLNYGSRHSGVGGEFNASSADFAPAAMGYAPTDNLQRRLPAQASKPSAWNTMSISPPARPTITESAKEPSMAAFLVAILIPFPGERRGSTCNSLQATLAGYDYTLDQMATPARRALQATIWWLEGEGG